MSDDATVIRSLIQTLEDGHEGFARAAEQVDDESPELAATFRRLSAQREAFGAELRSLAAYQDEPVADGGTITGAIHRGWLSLRGALSGSDPHAVVAVAEQGEDHAVAQYQHGLEQDVSSELRAVLERQFVEVKAAHDRVRALKTATT